MRDASYRFFISSAENYSRLMVSVDEFLKTRPKSNDIEIRARDFIVMMSSEIRDSSSQAPDLAKSEPCSSPILKKIKTTFFRM